MMAPKKNLAAAKRAALCATFLVLGGCAQLMPAQPVQEDLQAQPGRVPDAGVAGAEPGTDDTVTRTSRPRLAGQQIVLRSTGSSLSPETPPGVTEVGKRGAVGAPRPAGQAPTLREAARSIIPTDYAVRPAACVAQQAPTVWSHSENWVRALHQVMVSHALVATVDHDLKQVLIDKQPAVDPDAPRDWALLRSDATLRRALDRWLTPACVQLEWDVPFPLDISADRVYRGVDLWTALRSLAKELEASDTPIQIIHHPNVVRIASGQLR